MNGPLRLLTVAVVVAACTPAPSATPSAPTSPAATVPATSPSASASSSAAPAATAASTGPLPTFPTTTWRAVFSSADTVLGDVIAGQHGFLATGCRIDVDGDCMQPILIRSTDGSAWTATAFTLGGELWPSSLKVVGERLFAVGYGHFGGAGGAIIATSTDWSSWSAVETTSFLNRAVDRIVESPAGNIAVGIEAPVDSDNTSGFVVWPVGSDGSFGRSRVVDVAGGPAILSSAIWTGTEFLAWGPLEGLYGNGPVAFLSSPDGATWRLRGSLVDAGDPAVGDVVGIGDRLVAVGYVGQGFPLTPSAWVSDDAGRSWQAASLDGADARIHVLERVDDRLVARGYGSETATTPRVVSWTSTRGKTWAQLPDDEDMPAVPGFLALTRATLGRLVCVAGTVSSETESQGVIFCR